MKIGFGVIALIVASLGCSSGRSNDDASENALTAQFSATVTTNPATVAVNVPTQLDVRIADASGTPVKEFDPLHTQNLHLIAVSSDLEDFIHVHPDLRPAGDLTVDVQFKLSQPYSVFLEYDPKGAAPQQTSRANIVPTNAVAVAPRLTGAFAGTAVKEVVAGNTRVQLQPVAGHMIMPNMPAHFVFRFADAVTGQPVDDLTNWLGMPAHAIVVSPDLKTFIHLHGMADSGSSSGMPGMGHMHHGMDMGEGHDMGSTATGPIGVDVTFPKAGLYKMFFQFKRGDEIVTAPFVVEAMDM